LTVGQRVSEKSRHYYKSIHTRKIYVVKQKYATKLTSLLFAMMTIADSPQTSSYCPFGKWINRETLILSLNVSTKQLALWVKLQVLHVKVVHGNRVSFHGSPFESSTFYYVTQEQSNVCLA
jgi:hypothetical protein